MGDMNSNDCAELRNSDFFSKLYHRPLDIKNGAP